MLSSSPDHNAIGTSALSLEATKQTSKQETAFSLLPSPSESLPPLPPPTRSRFFTTPPYSRSKTRITIADREKESHKAAESNKSTAGKGRKPTVKSKSEVELPESNKGPLDNKENGPRKPKRTRKKPEQSRARGENSRNKTITGKVSKSGTEKSKASGAKAVDGEQAIREEHFGKQDLHDRDTNDLQLEPALKRRLDWTPSKERPKTVADSEEEEGAEVKGTGIGKILSGYEYDGSATSADRTQALADEGPTKRRRIEVFTRLLLMKQGMANPYVHKKLVDSRTLPVKPTTLVDESIENGENDSDPSKVPQRKKKPKAQTKRLATLTARVTAPYRETTADSSEPVDLEVSGAADPSVETKSKHRKTKRKADETSKFKVPRTVVVSPEKAVQSLEQQELVFGTCSQLEQADSPTFLRDTQAALQESEKDSCALSSNPNQPHLYSGNSSTVSRLAAQRNLWSAAARDTDGSLVDVEVVDLIDSPQAAKANSQSSHLHQEEDRGRSNAYDIDRPGEVPTADTLIFRDTSVNNGIPPFISHGNEKLSLDKPKSTSQHPMPYYKGKTELELAKEIQNYGLKPIKNREKMIETLEKCWTAKHGLRTQNWGQSSQLRHNEATLSSTEPQEVGKESEKSRSVYQKKPKAHPQSQTNNSQSTKGDSKKTSTTTITDTKQSKTSPENLQNSQQPLKRSFIDVEEIQDSEDDELPSPSRILGQFLGSPSRREEKRTQGLPSSIVPSSPASPSRNPKTTKLADGNSPDSAKAPSLSEQISRAVRTQPQKNRTLSPAGTRQRPSWHEKILMYDPIYLEDFTVWLNTEGLGLVGEDREVGAGLVREWCESKGICCCYRSKKASHF